MYYLFKAKNSNQFIQVRDTDLKTTKWSYDWIPVWDESSESHWSYPPFKHHGFPLIGTSLSPFLSMDISEFFILYPEFAI